jgi:hypothetical protein
MIHFGVKGMHWGVRKSRSPADVQVTPRQGRFKPKAKGGENQPSSHDAQMAAKYSRIIAKNGTHALSNQELQVVVTRMNLDQQYRGLKDRQPNAFTPGKKAIASALAAGATINAVMAFANSPAGKGMKEKLMKGVVT